jgi:inhibitor of cysteine peptidase
MMRFLTCFMLVSLVAATAGCEEDSDSGRIVLTAENNGQFIELAAGDEIDVVLVGNPTTGYEWQLEKTDESVLALIDSAYTADSDRIGSGGEYRFRFRAAAAGEAEVSLVYKRPWESGVKERFGFSVTIQ